MGVFCSVIGAPVLVSGIAPLSARLLVRVIKFIQEPDLLANAQFRPET